MLKRRGLKLLRSNETRLDEEDPTPEGETHMPCKRGKGGDMQQRRECDRVFGYQYASIVYERHGLPLIWRSRGDKPCEVAMGVGMVMTGMRLAGVLIPVILLVMHVCGVVVIVEVGWTGMGKNTPCPSPLAPWSTTTCRAVTRKAIIRPRLTTRILGACPKKLRFSNRELPLVR